MAAFRAAIRHGADMIEADLRVTRDNVPVMLHDPRVDRTTDGQGLVYDLDWSDLQQLDAGRWFGPEFAGERVPRLVDLFTLAEENGIALCIEAKGETHEQAVATSLIAGREIASRGRLGIDVVASFDHEALLKAVEAIPGLRVAPDRLPERGASTAAELIAQARACRAGIIQHHVADLEADVVAQVQDAGIDLWAWPANTAEEIAFAKATGVAGIMGDDVEAISAAVAGRSSPRRLNSST